MSKFFKEKNNESAFKLFNKRIIYSARAKKIRLSNLVDFKAEKYLYGRVNRIFVPITIPQSSTRLKSISSKTQTAQNFKALNFVVDAFVDLQKHFDKCILLNKIDKSDEFLSSLKVYRAYMDPHDRYRKYISKFYNILKVDRSFQANTIEDFNDLADTLTDNFQKIGLSNPLTFPAFIKSRKNPINISGLAIEIANLDASNDKEKIDKFINSKNWGFYLNTCRTYGFMVDENVPWRLVADIGSQPMLEYASRYGLSNTNSILTVCYQPAAFSYYQTFTQEMYNMYYTLKPSNIIKIEHCNDGSTIINKLKPTEYKNIAMLEKKYGQESFLMLYCKLRFMEEESQYTKEDKNIIIKDILAMSKKKSRYFAISKFENFLNKTLDYQGSLSYYINKSRARKEEEIFGEQTTGY